MKVAFIEQASELGGVEYSTLRLATALNSSYFQPLIICPEEGKLTDLARQMQLEVSTVPHPKFESVSWYLGKHYIANPFGFLSSALNIFRSAYLMQQYLRANPVDIVITKGLMAHFYGGLAAHWQNIPCIWYVQEEVDKNRAAGLYRLLLIQGASRIPSKVVVDAEALLDQFKKVPNFEGRVAVIYNGIDTEQFKPFTVEQKTTARKELGIPKEAFVIGQAGRIIPVKGQAILLEAFIKLVKQFPDLYLLLVGAPLFGSNDYEQSLRKRVKEAGISNQVVFSGFLTDIRQGLAAIDIFVQGSIEPDSPLSVIEAMSCGLAVIVSDVRGIIEMVEPDVNALLFEAGNSIALAGNLSKLVNDPCLREELGNKARASAIQKFSIRASATQIEDILKETIYV